MSKVAIITIISQNYGNRLQNLALQEALIKLGNQVATVPKIDRRKKYRKLKLYVRTAMNAVFKKYSYVVWEKFDDKIQWETNSINGHEDELNDKYDYFIAGSDQIWNPLFSFNSDRELLTFADTNKRIAYSASIGLNQFPIENASHYAMGWKKFNTISVREEQAATIVHSLTGRNVPVVIDPTMLLCEADWKKHVGKPLKKSNYYVKYFLGECHIAYENYIKRFAYEDNADVIEIMNPDGSLREGIGPQEFLNLILNSNGVFTDSFHGTVFSIIFKKPFIVFQRPSQEGYGNMSSRLDTLLATFQFEKRRVATEGELQGISMECDFSKVEGILLAKQSEAYDFLEKALR